LGIKQGKRKRLGEKTGDGRKKGLSRMTRSAVVVLFVDNGV
jgi:hypothetical protein